MEPTPFPGLSARLVHLEDAKRPDEAGPSEGERIEARPEDHVLAEPAIGTLRHEVVNEARPGGSAGARPPELLPMYGWDSHASGPAAASGPT